MGESEFRFRYILKYILPAFLSVTLFIVLFFLVIIPWFESGLLNQKRQMIRELTLSVVSIISDLNNKAENGIITDEQAREEVIGIIEKIRYGENNKDYFWITDMEPRMILHPYRKDLEGKLLDTFKDRSGKLLFMEFVQTVKENGEGYVDYMWQWEDDSTRIVPKLSFVKLYKAWGWIVGTGIYIEDVKQELAAMKRKLAVLSGIIILVISFLLLYLIRQGFRSEKIRLQTEEELEVSKEKYQTLVETSPEGTIMYINGKFVYANLIFLAMTGYTQKEISQLSFSNLFVKKSDPDFSMNKLQKMIDESGKTMNFEAQVRTKDNKYRDVIVMASAISYLEKEGVIFITKDISRKEKVNLEKELLADELQSSLLLMNLPVTSFMKQYIRCNMNQSIYEAAAMMHRQNQDAVLITKDDRKYLGIVTDSDLRSRVIAGDHPFSNPVFEIMSSPLITIPEQALLYEAILLMKEKEISHLPVINRNGDIVGIFSNNDLIEIQRNSISYLIREIKSTPTIGSLKTIHNKVPGLVKTLMDSGARIQNITRLISSITDAITERVVDLAIEEMGKPAVRFAFLALGSEGRREQTLVTDQDNAIIFEDVPYERLNEVNKYFLYLGQKINLWLDKIGYNYCKGEIMAGNPQWCQPISRWKDYFTNWINSDTTDSSVGISVFFDFRTVYGDNSFAGEIRNNIEKASHDNVEFYHRLADNTRKYKLPLNIFKSAHADTKGAKSETVDIKTGIMPITDFARIYSLYHRIYETNTLLRMEKLLHKGELNKTEYDEITRAYDFLMGIRFRKQISAILDNEIPKNIITFTDLTKIERGMLRSIFTVISDFQEKLISDIKWNH